MDNNKWVLPDWYFSELPPNHFSGEGAVKLRGYLPDSVISPKLHPKSSILLVHFGMESSRDNTDWVFSESPAETLSGKRLERRKYGVPQGYAP